MTDNQINQKIHTLVMGECWHEQQAKPISSQDSEWKNTCGKCGQHIIFMWGGDWDNVNPSYISDLNAVHRAEVKVVETSGTTIPLMDAIERQVWPAGSSIWATARQRAEAVLRATGNWEEK